MFEEQSSGVNYQPAKSGSGFGGIIKILKILLFSFIALAMIGGAVYWFFLSRQKVEPINDEPPAASNAPSLGSLGQLATSTTIAEIKPGDFLIEQVSFENFYQAPAQDFQFSINDYSLPINSKTEVVNYYDVSRKLDLDPGLSSLNQNGFAILKNPDPEKSKDFYSSYAWLKDKGLPILVSADFFVYHYQNSVKLSYKYLEENLFYDSLWQISQELFNISRVRYEARRAKIGDTNDQVLEGERLELAFFAVALQLLKPQADQITLDKVGSPEKFSLAESKNFVFSLPDYLKDDVERELELIKAAKETTKSPVLLYPRNYEDFKLPAEYRNNPRLNNFYLTAKWLNSNFPLYYQGKDCPKCQLDENDWQVNLTAASFIAHDFYQSYEIKNQWARIYKTLGFFKGLREDLTYLDYQKVLTTSFGADYDLEGALVAENDQSAANFNKLRSGILALRFPEWAGGFNRDDEKVRPQIGFRVLADFYSPNDFIASELTAPKIGAYQGKEDTLDSFCATNKNRCKILSLDIINLIFSFPDPLWVANTNYQNFIGNFLAIKNTINNFQSWQLNHYWSNLKIFKSYLDVSKTHLPIFGANDSWKKREITSVKAFWLNLQSSADLVKVSEADSALGKKESLQATDYYYVEPNLALLDELVANSKMILGMYGALQINSEAPSAYARLEALNKDLEFSRSLIKKELSGEALSIEDSIFLGKLVSQYKSSNQAYSQFTIGSASLNYKFSPPKFLVLISKTGEKKSFSVGPIFSYSENR